MNPELFRQLLDKYVLETLSDAERDQLAAMLNDSVFQEELLKVLGSEWEQGVYAEERGSEEKFERIYRRLVDARKSGRRGRVVPFYRKAVMRWVAAAVVLFFLAGVAYTVWVKPGAGFPAVSKLSPAVSDVIPGDDGAVLTLADGSTLVLDSARDGSLGSQGATRLVKLKGGQLVYEGGSGVEDADNMYNTLTIPRGKQFQVRLPDGSRVWLNSASSLRYPTAFTGATRQVTVTGEAYFEVAENKAKPFVVEAGGQELRVLGTRFNINAYPDEVSLSTTLLEGAVKLSYHDQEVRLRPGEQGVLTKKEGLSVLPHADLERVIAWKNGLFSFRHADIYAIMRQLSRWYDVDVEYQGDPGSGQSFSGEIGRNLNLSDVLSGLQLTELHYRIEGKKKLVILP